MEKDGAAEEAVGEKSNGNTHTSASGALTGHKIEEEAEQSETAFQKMKIGDLCPECGEAAVVNEEGCRKCYACGFSEC